MSSEGHVRGLGDKREKKQQQVPGDVHKATCPSHQLRLQALKMAKRPGAGFLQNKVPVMSTLPQHPMSWAGSACFRATTDPSFPSSQEDHRSGM